MASQAVTQEYGTRSATEYAVLVANVLYGIAGLIFLAGLYVDWQGGLVIRELSVTPGSDQSGLFVLSIIILVIGVLLSKTARVIEARNVEKVDQTQEWTVDVGSNKR